MDAAKIQSTMENIERHCRYNDGVITFPIYMWEQLKQLAGIQFEPEYLEDDPLTTARRVEALLKVTFPRRTFTVRPDDEPGAMRIRYEGVPDECPHSMNLLPTLFPIKGYRFVFENMK